jgi:hypothetical protein
MSRSAILAGIELETDRLAEIVSVLLAARAQDGRAAKVRVPNQDDWDVHQIWQEDVNARGGLLGPDRAVRLAGAASRLRELVGATLPPVARQHLEQGLTPAGAALSRENWAALREDGLTLALEQALEEAVSTQAARELDVCWRRPAIHASARRRSQ